MNAVLVAVLSLAVLALGYRFYSRAFEKFLGVDRGRPTPAVEKFDGIDYVPAKNWMVLFGHHFSSIAGAGPIVGPIIALSAWGWHPTLLFILLGSIFIGGIHDFGALILSVRHHGHSVSEIAGQIISRRAKLLYALFVFVALVIVCAVFVDLAARTFVVEPRVVVPALGLIPVAMLVGVLLYTLKYNQVISTLIGLVCLAALLVVGSVFPIALPHGFLVWSIVLLIYCYAASVLPVQLLLQPRDYLCAFLLVFGVVFGYIGLLSTRPVIALPGFIAWHSPEMGGLWPMLFVVVACGAISGFHAIVSSGTTAKQLANERDGRKIGYGAMIIEAAVAVLALLAVAVTFKDSGTLGAAMKQLTPVGVFGRGYGEITRYVLGSSGGFIAIMILNAFILTTLDTATRLCRYICEELFSLRNRFISTAAVVGLIALLVFSGSWQKIWPVFGAANQLIAALALLVLTAWFLARKQHTRYTLFPMAFMLITTLAALGFQFVGFARKHDIVLSAVTAVLIILALWMAWDVIEWFKKGKRHA